MVDKVSRYMVQGTDIVFKASDYGAVSGSDNSSIINTMLSEAAAARKQSIIDVDSVLTNITVPSNTDLKVRANLTHSSTSTHCFNISNADFISIDFGKDQGFSITRSGNKKIVNITGTSNYSNKEISVTNFRCSGGSSAFVEFYAVEKITIQNGEFSSADGQCIKNISNAVTNPYKSKYVHLYDLNIHDLVGSTDCTGIAINSWMYVDYVFISRCVIDSVDHNNFEIWANHVFVWGNIARDGSILYSFGGCHYLHCWNNEGNVTTPSTSGYGGYGIEIGACHFFNVHHNQIRGCRSGIRTTGGAINGGTDWYTSTELYSLAGSLDASNTNKLYVLSRDYASGINYSGSNLGIIDSNIFVDCLNTGIYVSMDYYNTRSIKIANNILNRIGRYDTPTEAYGAITCFNGLFDISGNIVEDTLYAAIYNSNSRIILGANKIKKCDAATPYTTLGLVASYNFLSKQDISQCTIAGVLVASTPTQGTWYVGDTLFNHAPAAGGSLGVTCTTAGTQSTQLNTRTATTTSGSNQVVMNSLGDVQIGVAITIAGVTGTKTVTEVTYNTNTITVDSNCDASVSGAVITNASATFKALPSIAA